MYLLFNRRVLRVLENYSWPSASGTQQDGRRKFNEFQTRPTQLVLSNHRRGIVSLSDEGNEGTDELSVDLSAAARWNFSCRRLHITSLLLPSRLFVALFSPPLTSLLLLYRSNLSFSLLPRSTLGSFVYFTSKRINVINIPVFRWTRCAREWHGCFSWLLRQVIVVRVGHTVVR